MAEGLQPGVALSLVVAASLAAPARAAASMHGAAADAGCRAAVERRLAGWGAGTERYREPDGPFGARQWRMPTPEIGTWILLHEPVGERASLARVDAGATTRVTFDAHCQEAVTSVAPAPAATTHGALSDEDIRALVAAEPKGVIYLWSPHMPLSVDGYRPVSETARRMGLSFTAVRDPLSDPGYAAAVVKEAGLPASALRTFASVELSFRQLSLHAPAVLVFANGRFAGLAVPGYREAGGFEAAISERLRSMSLSASRRRIDKEP